MKYASSMLECNTLEKGSSRKPVVTFLQWKMQPMRICQPFITDIPKLKRNRLDYVLEQLDRYLLEAYMMVTGRTTQKEYSCEPIRIDDYRSEDLVRYGYALKHRAAVLGNDLIRKGEKAKKPGTKILKVCHSFLKDGYDEYSNNSLAYYRRRVR